MNPKKRYSIDYETTGLALYKGDTWFSFSLTNNEDGYTEVFYGRNSGNEKTLRDIWRDPTLDLVAHNAKFERTVTIMSGIELPTNKILHDTMIMAQLVNNDLLSYGLDKLTVEFCNYTTEQDKEVSRWAKMTGNRYDKIPKSIMVEYQKHDGIRTALLDGLFYPLILENPRLHADYLNELALTTTTQRMEQFGVLIDPRRIKETVDTCEKEVNAIPHEVYRLFGQYLNLNSPKVCADLLYKTLGLPVPSLTENGSPSIDKDAILFLLDSQLSDRQREALHLIMKQRSYSKGSAMLNGYAEIADVNNTIHPNIKTNFARTGRESCSEPNLQNVSKDASLKTLYPIPARRVFVSRPKAVLLFVDYAGIEMRLIVDAVKEPELLKVLAVGGDLHAISAEAFFGTRFTDAEEALDWFLSTSEDLGPAYGHDIQILGKDEAFTNWSKKAKKVLRSGAKNGSFALAYGAGVQKIADTLNMPFDVVNAGVKAYSDRFPLVANYTNATAHEVKTTGGIMTAFGRFLRVPRHKAYMGANYKIQGTASGILKRAQVRVDEYLRVRTLDEARIIIPIHDEIVFHYPRKLLPVKHEILSHVGKLMTTMPEIDARLDVEWKMSTYSWDQAKDFKIDT